MKKTEIYTLLGKLIPQFSTKKRKEEKNDDDCLDLKVFEAMSSKTFVDKMTKAENSYLFIEVLYANIDLYAKTILYCNRQMRSNSPILSDKIKAPKTNHICIGNFYINESDFSFINPEQSDVSFSSAISEFLFLRGKDLDTFVNEREQSIHIKNLNVTQSIYDNLKKLSVVFKNHPM